MPTRKIADPPPLCRHPEHLPPTLIVFPPGTYEHECPACGNKMIFTVNSVSSALSPGASTSGPVSHEFYLNWDRFPDV